MTSSAVSPTISLEFFPPKTEKGRENFHLIVEKLVPLNPLFMSVTYGAGGSTQDWTLDTCMRIKGKFDCPVASHLTCINVFKDGIHEMAQRLWDNDVRHIVALRGDVPNIDMPLDYNDDSYYHYADELIAGLKDLYDFEISVAAYPKKHPEATDLKTDLENLKRKCDTGADRAITQFFFDNDVYYRFVEQAAAAGVTTPIVPGVLPVANYPSMLRFAKMCEANVPDWLHKKFAGYEDNPEDMEKIGQEILNRQTQDLVDNGVSHIHFYTLNKAEMTIDACRTSGLIDTDVQKRAKNA